jgi:hypothetical protein
VPSSAPSARPTCLHQSLLCGSRRPGPFSGSNTGPLARLGCWEPGVDLRRCPLTIQPGIRRARSGDLSLTASPPQVPPLRALARSRGRLAVLMGLLTLGRAHRAARGLVRKSFASHRRGALSQFESSILYRLDLVEHRFLAVGAAALHGLWSHGLSLSAGRCHRRMGPKYWAWSRPPGPADTRTPAPGQAHTCARSRTARPSCGAGRQLPHRLPALPRPVNHIIEDARQAQPWHLAARCSGQAPGCGASN